MTVTDFGDRIKTTEYQQLLRIVRSTDPSSALILGGVGMGKSSLVEAVLSSSGVNEPMMRLYCSRTLSNVPYGVLSPYLGALNSIDEPVQVLRELNAILATETDQHPETKIVVIEDAQYLDVQSSFVLSMLIENGSLKLIAVGAGALDAESALGMLAESSRLTTIVVQPLNMAGVRSVAETKISGVLSEGAVRIIGQMTGGNPRFVEAYIDSCLEQGILFRDDSLVHGTLEQRPVWTLVRTMPEVDSRLTDLVREVHQLASVQEQLTLEILALGGPLSTQLFNHIGLPFRRLLDAGELHMTNDSLIALNSELHQLVLRQMVPAARSAELHLKCKQASVELNFELSPWQVLWSIEIGVSVPETRVLATARKAADDFDHSLAWSLCTAADLAQHSDAGAMFEVQILMGQGNFYAARGALLRLIDNVPDVALLGEAFTQLIIVLTNLGTDASQVNLYMTMWEQRVRELNDLGEVAHALSSKEVGQRVLHLWTKTNSADGNLPKISELEELCDDSRLSKEAKTVALLLLSDRLSIAGQCQRALAITQQIHGVVSADSHLQRTYEAKILFRTGWNLLFLGEYARVQEMLAEFRFSKRESLTSCQGVITFLNALMDLLLGRFQLAHRKLAESVTEFRVHDPAQILSLALNFYCLSLDYPDVRNDVRTMAEPNGTPGTEPSISAGFLGDSPSKARLFARAVAAANSPQGIESLTDFPLIEQLHLTHITGQMTDEDLVGDPGQSKLAGLVKKHEGPRAELLLTLARLRVKSEAKPLEELGLQAVRRGDYSIAVEALARAASRYSEAGEPRSCGATLRLVAKIIAEQELNPNKYVSRTLALTELTAREVEIVRLALAGKNNAQIARVLTVSQRTVEGHLYRVFSKLGISDRAELGNAGLELGTTQYGK